MENYHFIKGYKDDENYRNSFNELAQQIFGINFEQWYQDGYWTERYQPFSYLDDGKVIANVSVNILDLVINGEEKRALQIGTVMTHPDYRNRGLSANLMNKVLEKYEGKYDIIYLFANHSVLDFYPKFGFKAVDEHQFTMDFTGSKSSGEEGRQLSGSNKNDLQFIYNFVSERVPVSHIFGTSNAAELVMFYCVFAFSEDIYYLEKEDVIVLCEQEEDQLHLFDVISKGDIDFEGILNKVAGEGTNKIVFHFTPDEKKLPLIKEKYHGSEVLYVKATDELVLPKYFKHPLTSQA